MQTTGANQQYREHGITGARFGCNRLLEMKIKLQVVNQIGRIIRPKTHMEIKANIMGNTVNTERIMIRHTSVEEQPSMETPEADGAKVNIIRGRIQGRIEDTVNLNMCVNFVDKAAMICGTVKQES